jgi:hypothetical protein
VIRALQALRGVSLITGLGIVVELEDITRSDRPEWLMSYAGLVPREYSSRSSRHPGGLIKTGNNHLRRLLIEASWHYRHHPPVGRLKQSAWLSPSASMSGSSSTLWWPGMPGRTSWHKARPEWWWPQIRPDTPVCR